MFLMVIAPPMKLFCNPMMQMSTPYFKNWEILVADLFLHFLTDLYDHELNMLIEFCSDWPPCLIGAQNSLADGGHVF